VLLLIIGLLLFLGTHSVRIVAEGWRVRMIARLGPQGWKGLYSVIALAGLVMMVQGYAQARIDPVILWSTTTASRHLASLLTLIAFILLVAAYVPCNRIRTRLRHPMVLGVKVWALAHLFSNGSLADLLLFGSILLWAILDFRAARQRDRITPPMAGAPGLVLADLATLIVAASAWAAFAFHFHARWIGISPMG
jgi:uncharacterized membrane protein